MNQDRDERTKLASWDDFQYDRMQQIPRELRFFPSDSHRAKSLSSQQVDAYNRQGFLTGIHLFDARQAAEIRDLPRHGSAANGSQRRRCGLTIRYAPADVRAYLGWHEKGVVCRGEDPTGHWANYPPPEE